MVNASDNQYGKAQHYKIVDSILTKIGNVSFGSLYGGAHAVVLNGKIHILGGGMSWDDSTGMYKHYLWNGGTSWRKKTQVPYPLRSNSCVVVFNDKIHVMGGMMDSSAEKKYHYSWDGKSWTQEDSLPYEFWYGESVALFDAFYILGGQDSLRYFYALEEKYYKRMV